MKKQDALKMDSQDPISWVKNEFDYGKGNKDDKIYFCGNSLGLKHRSLDIIVNRHLEQWKSEAVEAHFSGNYPWIEIQDRIKNILKDMLGCSSNEIAIMNALSLNLHLLMVSFFKPSKNKNKILIEENAFSSDRYVLNSQLQFHGYDTSSVLDISFDKEYLIDEEIVIKKIIDNKETLSLVLLPGIQYYNGQLIDLKKISKVCRDNGIVFGVDLAHAIGNVKIDLNELDIDFATWCSYKYLNSGAGGISGIYINKKHLKKDINRFEGWWGNKLSTRFEMEKNYDPDNSAEAWVLSNPPVILLDMHLAALKVFDKVGIKNIFRKSKKLTAFLYNGLLLVDPEETSFKIIKPFSKDKRGSQLSLLFKKNAKKVFEELNKKFVIDYRKPDVIRVAPVPLYNSFYEIFLFISELKKILNETK